MRKEGLRRYMVRATAKVILGDVWQATSTLKGRAQ